MQERPSHCKKWSSTCGESPSHHRTAALNFSAVVSPSSSVSSYEQHYHHPHKPYQQQPWPVADDDAHEAKQRHPWTKARCGGGGQVHVVVDDEDVKLVNVKSHDSSASNGSVEYCRSRFKELTAENLKVLCSALEKEVPWQAAIVPEIASAVLRCRSGMARRRDAADASSSRAAAGSKKEDTWLLFLGGDAEGKARVARELARLVFGSRKCFVYVGAAAAASSPARSSDSVEQRRHKRPRLPEASGNGCVESLYEAVRDSTHRVVLVEDVEQAGQRGILEAIERGSVRSHGGEEAALGEAIVVLSCESFDARSRTSSPPTTKKAKAEIEEEAKEEAIVTAGSPSSSCLDLNLNMSLENDDMEESCCTDAGLLKAVDRAFFFRRPDEINGDY